MSRAGEVASSWRAGFAVQVLLGSLGESRFSEAGPTEEPSLAYLKAVAGHLKAATGLPWQGSRQAPERRGYFVCSSGSLSYADLLEDDRIAVVEIITPPLPMSEAEKLRVQLQGWIERHDGGATSESRTGSMLPWRIVLEPGDFSAAVHVEPARLATFVDEVGLLEKAGRAGQSDTGIQRHAYGAGLLRALIVEPGLFEPDVALEHLIRSEVAGSQGLAARFSETGSAQLCHLGARNFMSPATLGSLLAPVLQAFEASNRQTHRGLGHLLSVFRVLSSWLETHLARMSLHMDGFSGFSFQRAGTVHFDGVEVGALTWQGSMELALLGPDDHARPKVAISGQNIADARECLALLCLDAIESAEVSGVLPIRPSPLVKAVQDLRAQISARGLLGRPSPSL